MDIALPPDFKDFLKLIKSKNIKYLLIGGYAVGYHGYPRATNDMDIWIAIDSVNAELLVQVLKEFGFDTPQLSKDLFLEENKIIRMGVAPIRIEILTSISGVNFEECYQKKVADEIDGIQVDIINLRHLKINKKASGRHKDLDDFENLP
jgi:predicted nucleotidyltransferase